MAILKDKESKSNMRKRFLPVHIVGIALIVGTIITLNAVTLNYRDLITRYFNQSDFRVEKNEDSQEDTERYKNDFETEEELTKHNGDVAKRIAGEGAVLLKNDESLPLSANAKISVFSVSSVDMVLGGTGSGSVDTSTAKTFKQALEDEGFSVNSTLWDFYQKKHEEGYVRSAPNWRGGKFSINEVPWADVSRECQSSFAQFGDAAVVVLSRSGGEGSDLTAHNFKETTGLEGNSGSYLELSQQERDMLDAVNRQFDNVVVLVNANNTMELGDLADYQNVKSVLWCGGLGQTGVSAIAEILSGKTNPSGKLVDTYVFDNNSAPAAQNSAANFWIENKPTSAGYVNEADQYTVYQEGIYVGYRYYETRYEDVVMKRSNVGTYDYSSTVLYPFGYGLSYTEFEKSGFSVKENDDSFTVSVNVKNTGDVAGKDVVEIYMQSPYTQYDIDNGIEKASVELVGFAKTDLLDAGEETTVTIDVDKSELTSYDYQKDETYILDDGTYYLTVADDAHAAVNNILSKKGYDTGDGMTANGDVNFVFEWKHNGVDTSTYSKDSATGVEIKNHFDFASIDYYDEYSDFKYLTRSDWTGTYPEPFCDRTDEKTGEHYITFPQELIDDLAPVYVEDSESYTMPTTGADSPFNLASLIGLEYDDPAWESLLDSLTVDQLQYIARNGGYGTPVIEEINKPATTEKDGPAGISATLIGGSKGMAYPTEVVLASTWNVDLAYEMGVAVGNDAMFANVQGWYAPAMNIHRTAYAGRNFEYYSEDGFISGKMGAQTVAGAAEKGLYTFVKHFAFNDTEGYIDEDNGIKGSKDGIATFLNEQAAREIYLKPFELAVKSGGSFCMMNAFNRIGTKWCGASSELLTDLLRDEWGFRGMIETDMAGLESYMDIRAGLQAGTDMWMNTAANKFLLTDYLDDPQIVTYLRRAAHNVLYTVCNSAAMNDIASDSRIIPILPGWIQWMIALDVVVGLGLVAWIGWLVYDQAFRGKKKKEEEKTVETKAE